MLGSTAGSAAALEPILRLEGLRKDLSAPGGVVAALTDVSLSVRRGQVVVVIGPSGAGKSTLLRCISMLSPPDAGKVILSGRDWGRRPPQPFNILGRIRHARELRELRSQIGIVFQDLHLFPHLNAWRNVALALVRVKNMSWRDAQEAARAELALVGLAHRCDSYPAQLSGGEKQRVAIARSVALKPQVMLFDEITSALDPELTAGVLAELKRLAAAGMTMIVVTHEMHFARDVADWIVCMDAGRIVEQGPAVELIANPRHQRTRAMLTTGRRA